MLTNTIYSRDARVKRYAEYLAKDGHQVDIVCLDSEDSSPQSDSPSVSVYPLPVTRLRREGLGLILNWFCVTAFMFLFFSKLQFKHRYDVVHIHNMPDFLVFCALLSKLRGCPIVLNVHDPVPELARAKLGLKADSMVVRTLSFLERMSIKFSTHVITPTLTFKDALVSRGVPPDKITIVTNAADPRFFPCDSKGTRAEKTHSGFTLLYVGTVADRYGLLVCVHALPELRDRIPGIKLRIVPKIRNEGIALDRCIALADKLGVRDLVQVDPPVPLERVADVMRQADVGIYPATVDCHMDIALSLKIPEMAMVGLPIVATRLSILEELFGSDSIAFVPSGDPAAFASKIVELYESPDLRDKLAENACRKAGELSWEDHYETYRRLLERLVQHS